ncbi:alpha-galactosidase [Salinibacterium xinjiangense]|uniref:Alpha-galactosidase n=1 Tax=Salinibacterium xinjiangense TaxID=386302 RepID=A0A2C8ZVI1_9MICO|nr:alpha-galactosidase [Salinibacterium xinjiangense]SOE69702.1 alpha-galactosidase [Salinibacterium xinjiangense]
MTEPCAVTRTIDWGNSRIRLRMTVDAHDRLRMVALGPADRLGDDVPQALAIGPVELQLAGDQFPQGARHVELGGTEQLRFRSHEISEVDGGSTLTVLQYHEPRGARVESTWTVFDDIAVIRCVSRVVNDGAVPLTIEYVSSFAFSGFVDFGRPDWADTITLAVPHNTFFGEYQWIEQHLPDHGIYDVGFVAGGEHSSRKRISIGSVGTQPTTEYLPMGALRDAARGVSWAWQIEHNGSWQWELGDLRTAVYVTAGGPNDQEHQWHTVLAPGESFETVPVAVAAVVGDVAETFIPLTSYRRRIRRPHRDDLELGVVFNDYMNSLLADPTEEKLMPVIAAAAAVGAEYYTVDAGWYSNEPGWWSSVGAWTESTARFPRGFSVVFDAIREAGMVAGLWIEPEVIGIDSPLAAELPRDAFFVRNGSRVNGAGRYQLDFRSSAVISRMDAVIDRLIADYGLGYLKFDYNINGGIGTDIASVSAGDGLLGHNRAFLEWIDRLFDRHPSVIIEACASGGGRADGATLARHSIMSTSDQTDPLLSIPIAAGAVTAMTPEQAAIWVYPQPEFTDDELHLCIINGLLGRPQLSGGMWKLDRRQLDAVRSAITLYKGFRHDIATAIPLWPLGLPGWSDAWCAQALQFRDRILVSVWRRGGDESVELDFPRLAGLDVDVELLFPADQPTETVWNPGGSLSVKLPNAPSARLFSLTAAGRGVSSHKRL